MTAPVGRNAGYIGKAFGRPNSKTSPKLRAKQPVNGLKKVFAVCGGLLLATASAVAVLKIGQWVANKNNNDTDTKPETPSAASALSAPSVNTDTSTIPNDDKVIHGKAVKFLATIPDCINLKAEDLYAQMPADIRNGTEEAQQKHFKNAVAEFHFPSSKSNRNFSDAVNTLSREADKCIPDKVINDIKKSNSKKDGHPGTILIDWFHKLTAEEKENYSQKFAARFIALEKRDGNNNAQQTMERDIALGLAALCGGKDAVNRMIAGVKEYWIEKEIREITNGNAKRIDNMCYRNDALKNGSTEDKAKWMLQAQWRDAWSKLKDYVFNHKSGEARNAPYDVRVEHLLTALRTDFNQVKTDNGGHFTDSSTEVEYRPGHDLVTTLDCTKDELIKKETENIIRAAFDNLRKRISNNTMMARTMQLGLSGIVTNTQAGTSQKKNELLWYLERFKEPLADYITEDGKAVPGANYTPIVSGAKTVFSPVTATYSALRHPLTTFSSTAREISKAKRAASKTLEQCMQNIVPNVSVSSYLGTKREKCDISPPAIT